jgi:hypothetical protein
LECIFCRPQEEIESFALLIKDVQGGAVIGAVNRVVISIEVRPGPRVVLFLFSLGVIVLILLMTFLLVVIQANSERQPGEPVVQITVHLLTPFADLPVGSVARHNFTEAFRYIVHF